jgi:etoposide-induced 2.4 mRNA
MLSIRAYWPSVRALFVCIFRGIADSLRLNATLVFFLSSTTVRVRTMHCLMLNGVIFLGSLLLADYVWAPIVRAILDISMGTGGSSSDSMPIASASIPLPGEEQSNHAAWLNVILLYAYQLLWVYPLYALSFILNAIYYQEIAEHAFNVHGGVSAGARPAAAGNSQVAAGVSGGGAFQKWVATMSDEVYRLLLVTAYMAQVTVVSFIPYIGSTLVFVHLCWLYSLYSFESVTGRRELEKWSV